jgi:hypothetical protein
MAVCRGRVLDIRYCVEGDRLSRSRTDRCDGDGKAVATMVE